MDRYIYYLAQKEYMQASSHFSKGPTTALRETREERKKSFSKMKTVAALVMSIPAIIGSWQAYKCLETNYPVWKASIYKIDSNGTAKKVWDKGNVRNIQEFLALLPGGLNTNNERLLEKLNGLRILFHTKDHELGIGGNYENKKKIIHVYPETRNGVLLHELLHHIYDEVLTDEERAEFNAFAKKVYSIATKGRKEQFDVLHGKLTPQLARYYDAAYEIILRVDSKKYILSEEEFTSYVAGELFSSVVDLKEFGIAEPVKKIYERYLDGSIINQLANPHTKDMF
ncbi:MAG: hypothetical protein N3G76_00215 [Candidatus Micrarchaeota archaeon]|nr:hypothetical protein [Candidatus Micrarchaeota archaeon]